MRLMSDVPLGMFFSGGLDSSAIAALMKRMVDGPVKTFAVGYREAALQRTGLCPASRRKHRHGASREVVIGMEDFFNALPRLIWHEDEPIAWPSSVSLYFVSKLASEQVKVVLTGEGSDELFARLRALPLSICWNRALDASGIATVPGGLRNSIRRASVAGSRAAFGWHAPQTPAYFRRPRRKLESLYLDNFYAAFSPSEQTLLLEAERCQAPTRAFCGYWNAGGTDRCSSRMLYADQKTYLVELLMKQDQMSMAASIESRVPFLDHPLVEFATRVPEHLKIRKERGQIHRQAGRRRPASPRDHLPQEDGLSHATAAVAAEDAGRPLMAMLRLGQKGRSASMSGGKRSSA